jgi:protein-S-isoprenylcysteine O-methyltransferase Ste14
MVAFPSLACRGSGTRRGSDSLGFASCWLSIRAVQTLDKQWTYAARVIKGHELHELITQGPYGVVRNPIYLGMFGLMFSTCLAYSHWWSALAAIVLFLIGNHIRIRTEEQLLSETFGDQFNEYARSVPAFIPRPWR